MLQGGGRVMMEVTELFLYLISTKKKSESLFYDIHEIFSRVLNTPYNNPELIRADAEVS